MHHHIAVTTADLFANFDHTLLVERYNSQVFTGQYQRPGGQQVTPTPQFAQVRGFQSPVVIFVVVVLLEHFCMCVSVSVYTQSTHLRLAPPLPQQDQISRPSFAERALHGSSQAVVPDAQGARGAGDGRCWREAINYHQLSYYSRSRLLLGKGSLERAIVLVVTLATPAVVDQPDDFNHPTMPQNIVNFRWPWPRLT